jgi:hypothetical protein
MHFGGLEKPNGLLSLLVILFSELNWFRCRWSA